MTERSIVNCYNKALQAIKATGADSGSTLYHRDDTIVFDLKAMNDADNLGNYKLFMPAKRGELKSSMKYAIAESVWYRKATQSIDLIVPFGKIWSQMTDSEGKVNSNYGYQLLDNNDLSASIDQLAAKINNGEHISTISLKIISEENQSSSTDLVCNNIVELTLVDAGEKLELSAHVIARSIDAVYGLPYDMFAAQGLMCYVATMLRDELHNFKHIDLDHLSFAISNFHIYKEQLEHITDNFSDEVLVFNRFDELPFSPNFEIDSIENEQDIRDLRDRLVEQYVTTETITTARDFKSNRPLYDVKVSHESLSHLSVAAVTFVLASKVIVSPEIKSQVELVVQRLQDNKFDRKAVIYLPEVNKIMYLVFDASLNSFIASTYSYGG